MAEVWGARVEGPEGFVKPVALKFVVDSGDPDMDRLFVNEARLAAELQHPNLVTVFDFDRIVDATDFGSPGRYYIAMERIDGQDLRHVVRAGRDASDRLPVSLALHVGAEVLQGLRYVHERRESGGRTVSQLVHRDVSPHNILVAYAGDVKLSDFGIAKSATRGVGTQPGLVRGKLAYASPEQIRGRALDHRSDQFSLGVTLWELLADRRLFAGGSDPEVIGRVLSGQIPALPTDLNVDRDVESVIRRMLESDVDRRFPSTGEALAAVRRLAEYQADGAELGQWMRRRFPPKDSRLPPTQVLPPARAQTPTENAGLTRRMPVDAVTVANPVRRPATPTRERETVLVTDRIDLATRAPVSMDRPRWLLWGGVAFVVAVATWTAVFGLRRPVPGIAVAHGSRTVAPSPSAPVTAPTEAEPIQIGTIIAGEGAHELGTPEIIDRTGNEPEVQDRHRPSVGGVKQTPEPAARRDDESSPPAPVLPTPSLLPTLVSPPSLRPASPRSVAPDDSVNGSPILE